MKSGTMGIDVAGYSKDRTAIAVAEDLDGMVKVTIYQIGTLGTLKGKDDPEKDKLIAVIHKAMEEKLKVVIDIPLDIEVLKAIYFEGTPTPSGKIWQRYYRPVDYLLGGLAPLGDHIGKVVTRVSPIYHHHKKQEQSIWETYPAGSLLVLKEEHRKVLISPNGKVDYKKTKLRASLVNGELKLKDIKEPGALKAIYLLKHILKAEISFNGKKEPIENFILLSDHIDAILSALAGLYPLEREAIITSVKNEEKIQKEEIPDNFILLDWKKIENKKIRLDFVSKGYL